MDLILFKTKLYTILYEQYCFIHKYTSMLYENTTYHTKSYIHCIYLYSIEQPAWSIVQRDIYLLSQHSSSIVSIRLFLDNDYGTILSYWNKGGNNVGNIEATFLS
jgi:hypothetical protein